MIIRSDFSPPTFRHQHNLQKMCQKDCIIRHNMTHLIANCVNLLMFCPRNPFLTKKLPEKESMIGSVRRSLTFQPPQNVFCSKNYNVFVKFQVTLFSIIFKIDASPATPIKTSPMIPCFDIFRLEQMHCDSRLRSLFTNRMSFSALSS